VLRHDPRYHGLEQVTQIALREGAMVQLHKTHDKVKEVWQGQLGHVTCQFVQDPVEVDLDTLTEGVISY